MTKLALVLLLAAGCPGDEPLAPGEVRARMSEATCARMARCTAADYDICVADTMRSLSRRMNWPAGSVTDVQMATCEAFIEGLACDEELTTSLWYAPECAFGPL